MEVAFTRANAVFVGRVLQIAIEKHLDEEGRQREMLACKFQVIEAFKGVEAKQKDFVVVTNMGNGTCGFPFELGDRYLVYAYLRHGVMMTNICQRTRALVMYKDDLIIVPPDAFSSKDKIPELDESGKKEADQIREFLKRK
jgi:hypothetical protein